ncbi:MAG: HAD family hydrolase [Clostridia bacterium]|nr:HAD family hydrolase [Clostridia bacterium]
MLKAVIFDIDGTLWQTGASYIYSYNKLCDLYGITNRKTDEEVLMGLGIRLELLLEYLVPDTEKTNELAFLAVNYSVEYLKAHENECCFDGVCNLLARVSEEYSVYLVSNCPRLYADTFMQISGTADYIKGIYTIEDGEKTDNINKIAKETEGKLLYVGDSTEDYDALTDRYTQYFCYAKYGYNTCDRYDYSIDLPSELSDVLRRIEIKERQSGGAPYRVFSKGDNQITLIRKGNDLSYFGFVKCIDDRFNDVVRELREVCDTKLIGPIDFNTFYSYRFALDHYDLRLYPDLVGERELPFFLQNGFLFHQEYVSILAEADLDACKRFDRIALPSEYSVKELHGDEVYSYLDDVYDVAVSAFEQAYLYEPIDRKDFIDIYVKALKQIIPDMLIIYHLDKPIGFCFCYEDPEKRFYVCKTVAIKSDERNSRVLSVLIKGTFDMMKQRGHKDILHHFKMRKATKPFNLYSKNILCTKRYTLLEYESDK